jgi:hypothetical protein
MKQVSVIVEGDEDVRFPQDFITKKFDSKIEYSDFIKVGGKAETIHLSAKLIETSTARGKTNILIFDADTNLNLTHQSIRQKERDLGLKFDSIFLLPNNQDTGNLETLLHSCIPTENQNVFDCIKSYGVCTSKLGLRLREIDEKEELYIYHGSFLDSGAAKGIRRDYLNPAIWNLDSANLNGLKAFLEPYFS